jgi:glycosyltransferase involved in cell wall biosynthesis
VVPTYNYARFLARAIDSVLSQGYAPLECIVVDDGSTDETARILDRYRDRVHVVRQEHRGVSAARNAGLRVARGKYVALLDADDAWKPGKLARQVPVLEADDGAGAVGCGVELLRPDLPPLDLPPRVAAPELPWRLRGVAVREAWVEGSSSGAVIPARVLADVGPYDEGLEAAEDWDMWMRIAARYRILNVPEVLVSIWRHGTGTFRDPDKMERAQRKVYEAAIARWPDALDGATRRRMRAMILDDAGLEYVLANQRRRGLRRLLAAARERPLDWQRWRTIARLAMQEALGA